MKVAIASDHKGFEMKNQILMQIYSINDSIEWIDLGPQRYDPQDDYTEYASALVTAMKDDTSITHGILVCGSGVGMSIVANKYDGIRCGLAIHTDQVKAARSDDDINVLAIAADFMVITHVRNMVEAFLVTLFSELPAHQRRLDMIQRIEEQN